MAKALVALGADATVLVRSAEVPRALGVSYRVCPRMDSPALLRAHVSAECDRLEVDTLVLDTFPEGLLGELEGPWRGPRRVALLRCRKDADTSRFRSAVGAVDTAVDLEPHLAWCPSGIPALGPITRLGAERPVSARALDVLIVASEPVLVGFARRLSPRLTSLGLRVRVLDDAPFPFPIEACAPRVLIGPAGFNLTYEAQALGMWHLALPRPRSHDDQHRRARMVAQLVHSPLAIERLATQLCHGEGSPQRAPLHEAQSVARFVLDG